MDPTEEEIRQFLEAYALQQRGATNPLAFNANRLGQGPGFLLEEDKPDSWKRHGDKDQILDDILSATDIDLTSLVPGLWPEVEEPDPADLQVTADPMLQVYRNDPAVKYVSDLVRSGKYSPTQAINAFRAEVENNPELYAGAIPMKTIMDNYDNPTEIEDWNGLQENVLNYLTADQEFTDAKSKAELTQAEWDDYVRSRSQYEMAGEPKYEDIRSKYAAEYGWDDPKLGFEELNPGMRPTPAARVPMDLSNVEGGGTLIPGMTLNDLAGTSLPEGANQQVTPDRYTAPTRNALAGAKRQQKEAQARADAEAIRNSPNRPMVGGIRGRGENQYMGQGVVKRDDTEERFMKYFNSGIEQAKKKKMASKAEENFARVIAAYNTAIFGQG